MRWGALTCKSRDSVVCVPQRSANLLNLIRGCWVRGVECCSVWHVFVLVSHVLAGLLVACSGLCAGLAKEGGISTQASTLLSSRQAEENGEGWRQAPGFRRSRIRSVSNVC